MTQLDGLPLDESLAGALMREGFDEDDAWRAAKAILPPVRGYADDVTLLHEKVLVARETEVRRLRERVDQLASLLAAESARVAERDAIIARVGALKVVSAWDGIVAGDWIDADDVQAILRGSA